MHQQQQHQEDPREDHNNSNSASPALVAHALSGRWRSPIDVVVAVHAAVHAAVYLVSVVFAHSHVPQGLVLSPPGCEWLLVH